jgi:hypothetical protein
MDGLVDLYPHAALLTLLNREQRVPYKVSKASTYRREASKPVDAYLRLPTFRSRAT